MARETCSQTSSIGFRLYKHCDKHGKKKVSKIYRQKLRRAAWTPMPISHSNTMRAGLSDLTHMEVDIHNKKKTSMEIMQPHRKNTKQLYESNQFGSD